MLLLCGARLGQNHPIISSEHLYFTVFKIKKISNTIKAKKVLRPKKITVWLGQRYQKC